MANEQNLIPLGSGKRSEKEEREMRSRGGKKSGETRRKKTAMKKVAKDRGVGKRDVYRELVDRDKA